jgi:hypothetical protein
MRRSGLPAGAALLLALATTGPASAERPEIQYMLHCQGCHLADGTGSERGVPSLSGFVARFLTVPGGREYLVRVPGSAQSPLGDAELAALLNWMIGRFGPAEDAQGFLPFTASEVGRLRADPLVDVAAVRARLVRRIEAVGPGADARSVEPR